MSNERKPLAVRRAELVAQCEQQRHEVRQEFAELKAAVRADGMRNSLRTYFLTHRKMLLGAGGVALGLVATRPKRLLSLAAAGMSAYKLARGVLPLLRS
jgi:hypothetical protein